MNFEKQLFNSVLYIKFSLQMESVDGCMRTACVRMQEKLNVEIERAIPALLCKMIPDAMFDVMPNSNFYVRVPVEDVIKEFAATYDCGKGVVAHSIRVFLARAGGVSEDGWRTKYMYANAVITATVCRESASRAKAAALPDAEAPAEAAQAAVETAETAEVVKPAKKRSRK